LSRQFIQLPSKSLDSHALRRTCARFATGITVATVTSESGEPMAMTVNSFTSVSADPPLVLICLDHRSSVLPHFRRSAWFGINVLSSDQQQISIRFSRADLASFQGIDWHWGERGVPMLDGVLATMECSVTQVVEAGDHAIFIGEVFRADCRDGEPLLYYGSEYRTLQTEIKPVE
jgi:flavin reductase (DIM6/NTAB) family NADH-FMN oxidoreductase RutF